MRSSISMGESFLAGVMALVDKWSPGKIPAVPGLPVTPPPNPFILSDGASISPRLGEVFCGMSADEERHLVPAYFTAETHFFLNCLSC